MTLSLPLDAAPRERPSTVSEAVEAARLVVEHAFPPLWVEGEVSNFKAYPSGLVTTAMTAGNGGSALLRSGARSPSFSRAARARSSAMA